MQHRFYGSPVKSPIGESSFITHVRCALINFTLKYKINSKNNDSIHDPHLFYVHILLTTFPHTPSTRSITHRFLSLEGEHMYIAIPPSNTQHSVSHKCCYRNSLGSKRFQSSYCAKVTAEAKKRLKGQGEGRRGSFFPLPSPVIHFFCSCSSFLDEPREETLATQGTTETTYFLFCCFYKQQRN